MLTTIPEDLKGEARLADEAATARVGAALGRALGPADAVMLSGDLGAGKTALARAAIAARLGRPEDIPSPTFTLVQVYEEDVQIWHADLYRLSDPEEIWELGLDEAFETAIAFVEWPDRLGAEAPGRRLELELSPDGEGRLLRWRALGDGWDRALEALKAAA